MENARENAQRFMAGRNATKVLTCLADDNKQAQPQPPSWRAAPPCPSSPGLVKPIPQKAPAPSSLLQDSVLKVLQDRLGIGADAYHKMQGAFPALALINTTKQMLPLLDALALKFSSKEIRKMVSEYPALLGRNYSAHLKPLLQYVQKHVFGGSWDLTRRLMVEYPQSWDVSIEHRLAPRVALFEEADFSITYKVAIPLVHASRRHFDAWVLPSLDLPVRLWYQDLYPASFVPPVAAPLSPKTAQQQNGEASPLMNFPKLVPRSKNQRPMAAAVVEDENVNAELVVEDDMPSSPDSKTAAPPQSLRSSVRRTTTRVVSPEFGHPKHKQLATVPASESGAAPAKAAGSKTPDRPRVERSLPTWEQRLALQDAQGRMPGSCDVLKHAQGTAQWPGNRYLMDLSVAWMDVYNEAAYKCDVAQELFESIFRDGGVFLERSPQGLWVKTSHAEAIKKIMQAFRDARKKKSSSSTSAPKKSSPRSSRRRQVNAEEDEEEIFYDDDDDDDGDDEDYQETGKARRRLSNKGNEKGNKRKREAAADGPQETTLVAESAPKKKRVISKDDLPPEVKKGPFDIVCGQGSKPGDPIKAFYYSLIADRLPAYNSAPPTQKSAVVQDLLDNIQELGGRFVVMGANGRKVEIDDSSKYKKTAQAFRDVRNRKIRSVARLMSGVNH